MSNDIVFGIRLKADGSSFVGEVKVAREELDKLGRATGSASGEAAKLNRETGNLNSQMGALASTAKALATGYAAMKLFDYAKDAALLGARYETLGISMYQAGKNAGYMRSEMDAYQAGLEKTGISMNESRNTLIGMAAANMDLANATKLARAAQDLAVVGNTNSSEAFNRLIYGIKSGQVEVLRTLGINVSFEESYKRLGAELGKNAVALTENEKLQARTSAAMEAAAKYQGIYEEAMGTAGKQLGSLARYQENYKVILGETFTEGLAFGVGAYTAQLKDATKEAAALKEKGDLKEWGRAATLVLATVADSARMVFNTVGAMATVVERIAVTAAILNHPFADNSGRRAQQEELKKQQAEFVAGMADNLKVYNSVNEGFAKSDAAKANAATKAARDMVEVPRAAAAAYLAAGTDTVAAQKAYIAVMEASNLEWKGRGKVDEVGDGSGGAKPKTKKTRDSDPEWEVQDKIDAAHQANRHKWEDDQAREYANAVEESNKIVDKASTASAEYVKQLQFENSLLGKNALEVQRLTEKNRIDLALEKELLALRNNDKFKSRDTNPEVDAAYQRAVKGAQDAAAAAKAGADIELEARDRVTRSWEFGSSEAIRKYNDQVRNSAAQAESLYTKAFRSAEDAVTKFAMTGKADIRSFGQAVLEEFYRINISRPFVSAGSSLLQSAMGAIGNYFGSTPAGASTSTVASFGADPTAAGTTDYMALAGYRASGGPVEPNSLYRVNEVVPEVFSSGGNDYLMTGGRGGVVTPLTQAKSSSGATPSQATTLVYSPNIQIDARGATPGMEQTISRVVNQAVEQTRASLMAELGAGGQFALATGRRR